ncbi:MAG TPA: T9SS type A sorting domain-containing protein [Bacteroidia bacterium]|nr:T9SS type A sorting domain-containing protein [Bacteroidia bacterium]
MDLISFVMIPENENSHESKIYTSIDNSPYDDITYYRLSSQDKEGTLKYHKIIAVTDDDTKELIYDYYQLHDDLIIEFKNVVPKNAALSLYDIAGQKISEGYVEERITKMPITYLSSGVYFIRITTPYKTKNFKLIIQK